MATPGTFQIQTLGCKLNYSESSTLSRQLEEAGWNVASQDASADLYILNTCSVTEFADKKCRQAVRRYKRQNPAAKVIVTGCYAQLKPQEIADIEGVDLVLGAAEKFNLLNHVSNLQIGIPAGFIQRGQINEHQDFFASYSIGDRTRAFLKIQDGCNYKCSFCTIPLARGKSRSATIDHVLRQAEELYNQGIKEIVLTGVNIGDFGLSPADGQRTQSFYELIQELDKTPIERFRISSIEPNLCGNDIIEFVAQSSRFMPHFHMPLQSGSDDMLRIMRRRYDSALYADRVATIKKLMPHACIGVDVIVGFHGETDERFDETWRFLHEIEASYFHVFTYSERSDTHAMQLDGKVDMGVRRQRNEELRILSEKKKHYFYTQHADSTREVLIERANKQDTASNNYVAIGHTDNYIKVVCDSPEDISNEIVRVKLNQWTDKSEMTGSLILK